MTNELVFLKLGGSLITDKTQPRTPLLDVIQRLGNEIHQALELNPDLKIVLGHGSGSFGHVPAHRHGTRNGVRTAGQWLGFVEVWQDARALNQIVVDTLYQANLPILSLPPSASVTTSNKRISYWDTTPLQSALNAGLIPLINGDVIFDNTLGGTILSTEELFFYLAHQLKPNRILLAGIEEGVWEDFPSCNSLIQCITPSNLRDVANTLGGSAATDVTGGMLNKVESMIDLVIDLPHLKVQIFSGVQAGQVTRALLGSALGTTISAN